MFNGKEESFIQTEEVIFYLDLSTDFAKERRVRKAIKDFISEYNELKEAVSYGMVLFKKNKEIFSLFDADQDAITEKIKELWEERDKEESYFENGLYYILAYIFKKSRTKPQVYRVIVLSDRASSQTNEYHTALYNLVLKCKNFSAFIDIIRVGDKKFYEDDVKLKIIASETFGGVLYCRDDKELKTYLSSLTESRKEYSIRETSIGEIDTENIPFYERLATDLLSLTSEDTNICILCGEEICQVCKNTNDILHKCYNCNVAFHQCCVAHYSVKNNIGIPYIFRCPNCGALLKIEKQLVETLIKKEKSKEIQKQPKQSFLVDNKASEREGREKIQVSKEQEITQQVKAKKEQRIRVGGFFGNEIVIGNDSNSESPKKKDNGESVETINKEEEEEKISITSLNPPKSGNSLKFCPLCGEAVKTSHYCPKCGSKID